MVEWTPEQKREYERGVREDYAEFLVAHGIEANGNRFRFIPARMLTLTGDSLRTLERRHMIENNGYCAYRPSK